MASPSDPDPTLVGDFYGDLLPGWVPDTTVTDTNIYTTVSTPKLYGDELGGKLRGVAIEQGSPNWLKLPLVDQETGAPLTIAIGQYSDFPTVLVRFREGTGVVGTIYSPDATDTPGMAADGTYLKLPIPAGIRDTPGVYNVQAMVRGADGQEKTRDSFYLLVQRGMWLSDGTAPTSDCGPPTVQEVRTAVRDHPGVNRLLGDFQYDPAEIGMALVNAVQDFNAEPPVGGQNYTTLTFPSHWRRQWLDGALFHLFETTAAWCRAGHLPYQAGGLAVDDLGKEKEFLGIATVYRERFMRWVKIMKVRMSVNVGWGSLGSAPPAGGVW